PSTARPGDLRDLRRLKLKEVFCDKMLNKTIGWYNEATRIGRGKNNESRLAQATDFSVRFLAENNNFTALISYLKLMGIYDEKKQKNIHDTAIEFVAQQKKLTQEIHFQ